MAYATSAQYLAVYDSSADPMRIDALLERASRKVDVALAERGAEVPGEPGELLASVLSDTCVDMVHRVLGDGGGMDIPSGVTQYAQSQGGFSESFSFTTPYSDLSVRADELTALLSLLGEDASGFGTCRFWGDAP